MTTTWTTGYDEPKTVELEQVDTLIFGGFGFSGVQTLI